MTSFAPRIFDSAAASSHVHFRDRHDAGRQLATHLAGFSGREDVIVLGLPRGGVPVAYEVAAALGAPLDVFIVRKLGHPSQPELAMGAIASGGVRVLNPVVVAMLPDAEAVIASVTAAEERELRRREAEYREKRPAPELRGKTVILIDDGIATGASMCAAIRALRQWDVAHLIVAAPIAAPQTCTELAGEADEVVCLFTPIDFEAVGQAYEDFAQTTDEEVRELLSPARG